MSLSRCQSTYADVVTKTKRLLNSDRDAVRFWAASAIVLGLTIILVSLFVVKDKTPAQDSPVPIPSTSATQSPTLSQSSSPTKIPPLYAKRPRLGSKIGTIFLKTLKLNWAIYEGTRDSELNKGVGHYRGSVLPGVSDNAILSGHRMTVFNRLGELKKRDLIYVKTSAGTFTYRVRKFQIVNRSNNHVIAPTDTPVLTLTTCFPFNSLTRTTDAFVVTADLVASNLKH